MDQTKTVTERLDVLVGRWRTEGSIREPNGADGLRIDATDVYEWLPGRQALLHTVDARVGSDRVEGAEIIGRDEERGCYRTLYFGTDGPAEYEANLEEAEDGLAWSMRSAADRFRGAFDDERDLIVGHWERLDEGEWIPWMDITLTREPGGPDG